MSDFGKFGKFRKRRGRWIETSAIYKENDIV